MAKRYSHLLDVRSSKEEYYGEGYTGDRVKHDEKVEKIYQNEDNVVANIGGLLASNKEEAESKFLNMNQEVFGKGGVLPKIDGQNSTVVDASKDYWNLNKRAEGLDDTTFRYNYVLSPDNSKAHREFQFLPDYEGIVSEEDLNNPKINFAPHQNGQLAFRGTNKVGGYGSGVNVEANPKVTSAEIASDEPGKRELVDYNQYTPNLSVKSDYNNRYDYASVNYIEEAELV